VDLFHEVTYATTMGQNLDMLTAPDGVDNFEAYNMTRYCQIVKFKTAFYTFYLPTACALQLSGVTAEKHYLSARNICLMIGEFFQIQDDYLDCYGAPEVIGKVTGPSTLERVFAFKGFGSRQSVANHRPREDGLVHADVVRRRLDRPRRSVQISWTTSAAGWFARLRPSPRPASSKRCEPTTGRTTKTRWRGSRLCTWRCTWRNCT
jgi:hypothetical protein